MLENALGPIFTSIFWDASQARALDSLRPDHHGGNACGKHFTEKPPKPQKVASRAGETPTCENEIVSGVGPNSFPKWGPRYLATLPSFLTTCPHINPILENAHGNRFLWIFLDASKIRALGWPGPRMRPADIFFVIAPLRRNRS